MSSTGLWCNPHVFTVVVGPTSSTNIGSTRKNHPLFHETIRWKSDVPLTEGQLRSKRDEFWETAPAFDGRKEIWDALRAATVAAEALDFQLAQAILDGANIFLANGYLTECYDELGSHYKIPIYCLSHPVNIVKEDHDSESPAEYSEPVDGGEQQEVMNVMQFPNLPTEPITRLKILFRSLPLFPLVPRFVSF